MNYSYKYNTHVLSSMVKIATMIYVLCYMLYDDLRLFIKLKFFIL